MQNASDVKKRIFHLALLFVVVTGVLAPTPAQAGAYYPPYTWGRNCYHYFWGTANSFARFCNNYYFLKSEATTAPAAGAWAGYITVGGKEFVSLSPNNYYVANAVTSASIMEFTSGPVAETVTATADVSWVYSIASSYWVDLQLCLTIMDWGPVNEAGYPRAPLNGTDCVRPNVEGLRHFAKTATVPPNRRFAIEVETDNTRNDGTATFDVYQMSCTGACLPRTPNPYTPPSPGGGGGGY